MRRQIDPDSERAYWQRKIEAAIAIYGKVRARYSSEAGLSQMVNVLQLQYIHMQPRNKYHRILRTVITKLEELRAEHNNPWEHLFEDYANCVHERYWRRHRVPFLVQMMPTDENIQEFLAWIHRWEQEHDQPYWIITVYTMADIQQRASDSIRNAQLAKAALLDAARTGQLSADQLTELPQEIAVAGNS